MNKKLIERWKILKRCISDLVSSNVARIVEKIGNTVSKLFCDFVSLIIHSTKFKIIYVSFIL